MTTPTKEPYRSVFQRAFYRFVRLIVTIWFVLFYKIRVHNIEQSIQRGSAMIMANHQSNLDPIVIGALYPGYVSFLAKKALFKYPPLSWVLFGLDCIPIDRESTGIGGMKETLRRLKKGYRMVLFPEGQRSFDGEMVPLMSGFCALFKRTKVPIVPIGLDGPFQAWPRGTMIPRPGHIHAVVGKPIYYSDVEHLSDREMTEYVGERIRECFEQARLLREQKQPTTAS